MSTNQNAASSSSNHVDLNDFLLNGEDEAGFSVTPKSNCPHIASNSFIIYEPFINPQSSSATTTSSKSIASSETIYSENLKCSLCSVIDEVWVCLRCGFSGCGRFKNKHMLKHASNQTAASCTPVVAMSLADLSTWCFVCDDYITHPKLEIPFRELHHAKIGQYPQAALHDLSSKVILINK